MSCAIFAGEDLLAGRVITARDFTTVLGSPLAADDFLPGTASDRGGRFNKDSALLVGVGAPDENEPRSGAYYVVLQDERLGPMQATRVGKSCQKTKRYRTTHLRYFEGVWQIS
jgi:hypothetical protein